MLKNLFQTLLKILVILFCIAILMYGFFDALNQQEVMDCKQWIKDSKTYSHFYITTLQDEQCKNHHIIIDAPII